MDEHEKFSVLIVDDEKSNLDILSSLLSADYRIYLAKSAARAMEIAGKKSPDLILLDVIMPEVSGFELLVELKESDITRQIPVIFITGQSNEDDQEKGFLLGAVDYITKPFINSIVKARVATHLQIVKQMRAIQKLGMTDPLTDLPNRRNFEYHINITWEMSVRDKLPLSCISIDVDNFKKYNDTYGHPQGDALLKGVSDIFTKAVRRKIDLVARIGGEEFAVILPNTNFEAALAMAETIRSNVESAQFPLSDGTTPTKVTISLGVASIIPTNNDTISELISKSDSALYAAKESGRNRVCGTNLQKI